MAQMGEMAIEDVNDFCDYNTNDKVILTNVARESKINLIVVQFAQLVSTISKI